MAPAATPAGFGDPNENIPDAGATFVVAGFVSDDAAAGFVEPKLNAGLLLLLPVPKVIGFFCSVLVEMGDAAAEVVVVGLVAA